MRRLALVPLVAACTADPALGAGEVAAESGAGPDGATAHGTSATEAGEDASSDADPPASGPPVVIDLGKDAANLTEGGSVVVTATVRDPDGDDDVAGGTLLLADPELEVTAFDRAENGRFTAMLTWADLQRLEPQQFAGTLLLPLRARFTDTAGAVAEAETTVLLVCAGLSGAACDGICVDLEAHDEHCGACEHACDIVASPIDGTPIGGCSHGACSPIFTACVSAARWADCTSVCADQGGRCAWACGEGYVAFTDADCIAAAKQPGASGCDPDPFGWPVDGSVRCCCTLP